MPTQPALDASKADEAATIALGLGLASLVTWIFPVLGMITPIMSLVYVRRARGSSRTNSVSSSVALSIINLILGGVVLLWFAALILLMIDGD